MQARFADAAEALRDIARWEKQRLHLIDLLASQGRMPAASGAELSGWRIRTALIEQSAELITILVPHENAVRALDPLLSR